MLRGLSYLLLLMVLSTSGCLTKPPLAPYSELTVSVITGDPPRSMAVLPFTDGTGSEDLGRTVRAAFYGHISVHPYRDVELRVVDRRLRTNPSTNRRDLSQISAETLGEFLGVDAVVHGEVTEYRRIFAGVYSQTAVGASIEIRDTRSGRTIWRDRHTVRFHAGGLPLNPLDIPLLSIRSGLNLRNTVKVRAVDELCRHLASRVPAPDRPPDLQPESEIMCQLQIGAFVDRERALHLAQRLKDRDFPASVRRRAEAGVWHRVVVGPYRDAHTAHQTGDEISRIFGMQPFISRLSSDDGRDGGTHR